MEVVKMLNMAAVTRMMIVLVTLFGDKEDYGRCFDDTDVNDSRYDDVNQVTSSKFRIKSLQDSTVSKRNKVATAPAVFSLTTFQSLSPFHRNVLCHGNVNFTFGMTSLCILFSPYFFSFAFWKLFSADERTAPRRSVAERNSLCCRYSGGCRFVPSVPLDTVERANWAQWAIM